MTLGQVPIRFVFSHGLGRPILVSPNHPMDTPIEGLIGIRVDDRGCEFVREAASPKPGEGPAAYHARIFGQNLRMAFGNYDMSGLV